MGRPLLFAEPGLSLPIEAVTQTFAFLGKRGGGKSYAATKLCELMLEAGAQIIALDVVGNWCGLRIPATKGGKAFDNVLVFGGLNGDFEINPKAGRIIAETIINKNLCAVVDISQFIHSEQTRFAYDFLTTIFEKKKQHPSAVHIFLEEAQELVPQNLPPKGGDNFAAKMLHAGERLVKLGRNFGIGCSLISQRPQEVNKKVLNQTEVFLAFQMTGLQERKTVAEWVKDKGHQSELVDSLPYLEIGQALCWSPGWLKFENTVRILPKLTADISATPKVGAAIGQTRTLKPVDVADLKKSIAELTDEIEKDTPAAWKKEIAELKKQLAQKPVAAQSAPAPKVEYPTKEITALTAAVDAFRAEYIPQLKVIAQGFEALNGQKVFERIEAQASKVITGMPRQAPAPVAAASGVAAKTALTPRPQKSTTAEGGLSKFAIGILNGIAEWNALGVAAPNRSQLGFMIGKSPRTGYFQGTVSTLKTSGYIEYPSGGLLSLTELGKGAITATEPPTSLQDFHNRVRTHLSSLETQMFDAMVAVYPNSLSRAELGQAINKSEATGYFQGTVSTMKTAGILEYPQSGFVRATDTLFPEGLY